MKDPVIKGHILKLVGKTVHAEIKKFCSDVVKSIIKCDDPLSINTFTWQSFSSEISTFAPVLKGILESTSKSRKSNTDVKIVVCMCVALLLRSRNPRMNLIQKMLSLILYAGHASKQVNQLLNMPCKK